MAGRPAARTAHAPLPKLPESDSQYVCVVRLGRSTLATSGLRARRGPAPPPSSESDSLGRRSGRREGAMTQPLPRGAKERSVSRGLSANNSSFLPPSPLR